MMGQRARAGSFLLFLLSSVKQAVLGVNLPKIVSSAVYSCSHSLGADDSATGCSLSHGRRGKPGQGSSPRWVLNAARGDGVGTGPLSSPTLAFKAPCGPLSPAAAHQKSLRSRSSWHEMVEALRPVGSNARLRGPVPTAALCLTAAASIWPRILPWKGKRGGAERARTLQDQMCL